MIHGVVTIGFAIAVLLVALASDDGLRTTLIVIAPIVMLIGALAALWRTYQSWRSDGRWQVWQGASWFLLALFVVFLIGSAPALMS